LVGGLTVSGFGPAVIVATVIAIAGYFIIWLLGVLGWGLAGGFMPLGALIFSNVAALVLFFGGRMIKGLAAKGFTGVTIAGTATTAVSWLFNSIVGVAS
jgi:hypothetical protein